ncbi:hypothetical protein Tsubulata_039167 [Turnera subulata]|uniref:CCHC-type domain-containing protein n=1 Tax=Turnera subulata TaxID=218843 RepID=A0A9Q0F5Q7_9ROSI|nr:hypothetical protein Tsubulata_039167 [Turnera subulata]
MSSSDDDFDSQLQSYMKARGWKEYCAMKELNSTFDYNGWRVWNSTLKMVIFFFGSEVVINKEKPKEPVETSSEEEKAEFTTWEWKNDLVLNIMKTKLCSGIYSSLESKTKYSGNAKQMMDALEQMAVEREKMFAHITLGDTDGSPEGEGSGNRDIAEVDGDEGENRSEQQGGDVEKKRNKVRCFSCGKKGHIAKNCQLAST